MPSTPVPSAPPLTATPANGTDPGAKARARVVAAMAEGFGVSPHALGDAEDAETLDRLARNAAAALAILATELRETQDERARLIAQLELGRDAGSARTPWINALGASSAADLPRALARALSEREPHEVEALRADLREARAFSARLADAAGRMIDVLEDALDPRRIRRRVRFLDRFQRGGKAAAVWRALLRDERVYGPKNVPRPRALLGEAFARAGERTDAGDGRTDR